MNPEDEIADLEALLQEFMQAINIFTNSGEKIDDAVYGEIAITLERLTGRIDQLKQRAQQEIQGVEEEQAEVADSITPPSQGAAPTGGLIPPLDKAPHESSNVNALKYDPKNKQLFVQFHGKYPQEAGSTYSYQGVPPNVFDIIYRGAVGPKTSGSNKFHTWQKNILPSHGAAVNALLVKGNYPYSRIS